MACDLEQTILIVGRDCRQNPAGANEFRIFPPCPVEEMIGAAAARQHAEAVVQLGRAIERDAPGHPVGEREIRRSRGSGG